MKTILRSVSSRIALLLLAVGMASAARAQSTVFTYQGRLNDNSAPANGVFDFRFRAASDPAGNNYVGGTLLSNAVPVVNGLFTVSLDFGAIFGGSNIWLEVSVRTNGAVGYTTLAPLQLLTPTPYAMTASNLSGNLQASQLSGPIQSGQLAGLYTGALNLNNPANNFAGNGASLSNVNALTLSGLSASNFWLTSGNAGTTAGANFLGTTDNQPLEIRVAGIRGLRIEPDGRSGGVSPNIIGSTSNNVIEQPGSGGNVIIGGGFPGTPNIIHSNVQGAFIGAGSAHQIGPAVNDAAILGGFGNSVMSNATRSFIGAGGFNGIGTNSSSSVISGGQANNILNDSPYSTIGGGINNLISSNSYESVIAGGHDSQIVNSQYAFIGGGGGHQIQSNTDSFIGSGGYNMIQANSHDAVIVGGYANVILNDSPEATIGGGIDNIITSNSFSSMIGGGHDNQIQSAPYTFIGGGGLHIIESNAYDSVIGGGGYNLIGSNSFGSTIAGGEGNAIQNNAANSTVTGGGGNIIQDGAAYSWVGGGIQNTVHTNAAVSMIGGGWLNAVGAPYGMIPGGYSNIANGYFSFAAGLQAQALHDGAFVWSDYESGAFASTTNNTFNVRAQNGARFVTGGAGITVDGQPALISGNGVTVQQNSSGAPNIIEGASVNGATAGVVGATIGGGGATNYFGFVYSNNVTGDFGTIGGGYGNSAALSGTVGGGVLNGATGVESTVGGGAVNNAGGTGATIGGGTQNNTYNNVTTIAGGNLNVSSGYGATVSGGERNSSSGNWAMIGGGQMNLNGGDYSVIAGGLSNQVYLGVAAFIGGGASNFSLGGYSVLAGGLNNVVDNSLGVIGGGWQNHESGDRSVISGGYNNVVQSAFSVVGGGWRNTLMNNSQASTISGGQMNTIEGSASGLGGCTIGGGWQNNIKTNNYFSTISGGYGGNIQSGATYSAIGGGFSNIISGGFATIPGGATNIASGIFSFAAGQQAQALNQGAFVWADSQNAPFASTGPNQFSVRANGGARFVTSGAGLTVDGLTVAVQNGANTFSANNTFIGPNTFSNATTFGAALNVNTSGGYNQSSIGNFTIDAPFKPGGRFVITTAGFVGISNNAPTHLLAIGSTSPAYCDGGSWVNGSDKNSKQGFTKINPRDVLEKVASLPITQWQYKIDTKADHLGPMAQDFHAAFGLNGSDDTHIATIDESGVALAAIQGLNEKLEQKVKEKDAKITDLEKRLAALESMMRQK